ncbi:Transcription elongation factor A N-terminal and central domain-containing protein [Collichthys lucidus]|uniref:Transcription elongation factor A N-terminal and central domain-containing protein n=1 Tax=Collichthys lucidus TaxID=240159 RepID=A0A4U5TXW9_COLLU|nr:Transcription elongation factor A N-terminal and central domain-containing protein [Collichthys lucidus]
MAAAMQTFFVFLLVAAEHEEVQLEATDIVRVLYRLLKTCSDDNVKKTTKSLLSKWKRQYSKDARGVKSTEERVDEVRSKCAQLLLAALCPELPAPDTTAELAGDVEQHIHELHKSSQLKYKACVRSKVANLRNPKNTASSAGPPERLAVARGLRSDVRGGDGERRAPAAEGGVLDPRREREAASSRDRRDADGEDALQEVWGIGLQGDADVQGGAFLTRMGETGRPRRRCDDLCDLQPMWAAMVPQRLDLPLNPSIRLMVGFLPVDHS